MNPYDTRPSRTSGDAESQRLMTKHEDYFPESLPKKQTGQFITTQRVYVALLHGIVLVLIALLWSRGSEHPARSQTDGLSWSPVQKYIEYEVNAGHSTDHHKHSAYSGWPDEEQDANWDNLMRPVYFNATKKELEKAGESFQDIAELEGGGYPASLGVYHELHCLRQLRFWLWKERYYPALTEEQDRYFHGHLDHCIETLRMTIMCHGNTALYSFFWDDPTADHPATQSNSKSECVKWDSIEDWSYSRRISTDPNIVRPSIDDLKD